MTLNLCSDGFRVMAKHNDPTIYIPANREVHGVARHNGEGGHSMGGPRLSKSLPAELMHNWAPDLLASLHSTDPNQ